MRLRYIYFVLTLVVTSVAPAQIVLDPSPARVVGHASAEQLIASSINPNLGVNGGMYAPSGVAVDTTGSTPILYVADTANHRVLAWKNATSTSLPKPPLTTPPPPDLIVGQPNAYATFPSKIGGGGLYYPTGLLVDRKGNLYIADSGNNRVLRYPPPFIGAAPCSPANPPTLCSTASPDIVLGQRDPYNRAATRKGNQGANVPAANTICLSQLLNGDPACPGSGGGGPFFAGLAMDTGGNLFVADAGNSRVLRFPAASLTSGALDPNADIVIGQTSMTLAARPSSQLDKNVLYVPAGLAFDAEGRLFVTDGEPRLLVFPASVSSPTASSGSTAIRLAGIVSPNPSTATASTLRSPTGIAMINDGPAVVDTGNNRVLIFDSFNSNDWATSDATLAFPPPVAIAVLGQGSNLQNFTSSSANAGNPQASVDVNGGEVATFWGPSSATVAGTDLFVVDASNHRVLVFPNAGQVAAAKVVLGQSAFLYNSPNSIQGGEFYFGAGGAGDAGIAVDSSSSPPHLYVADRYNNRVLGFADARTAGMLGAKADLVIGQTDPTTLKSDPRSAVCNLGGVANPPTENLQRQPTQRSLCNPTGLAVDPKTGDLFVADFLNARVLRFPAPFDPSNSSQQANLVLGQSGFTGIPNPQASQSIMLLPYGLDFDPNWGLFVSDYSANRVLLFSITANTSNGEPASKVIGQADFSSVDSSTLFSPHHFGVDSVNRIYVADTGHNQIQVFAIPSGSSTNQPIGSFSAVANGGGLSQPQAVWVNRARVPDPGGYQNDIWVGDRNGLSRFAAPPAGTFGIAATLSIPSVQVQPRLANTSVNQADLSPACPGNGLLITNATDALFCQYSALAITQDVSGNLYVADASNRVAIHYPALRATNSANYTCAMGCALSGLPEYYLAPGALASLFYILPLAGSPGAVCSFQSTPQCGAAPGSFTSNPKVNSVLPVPTTLADVQVMVNGRPSPMVYAGEGQINFIVPFEAPDSGPVQLVVVNPSTSQVLGSGSTGISANPNFPLGLNMNAASPAFFTASASGFSQIAALNCNQIVSGNCDDAVNGPASPANQGSVIQLYLTGQGLVPNHPDDGVPPAGAITTSAQPAVYVGGTLAPLKYSGLAPGYPGLWQINVEVPTHPAILPGFDPGVFPVQVSYEGLTSNTPTNNRTPCASPPTQCATTIVINPPQ